MASIRGRKGRDGKARFTVQVRMSGYPARTGTFATRRQAERRVKHLPDWRARDIPVSRWAAVLSTPANFLLLFDQVRSYRKEIQEYRPERQY
jgi:hypothetical protein